MCNQGFYSLKISDLDLMADGEAPHNLVDLDFGLVANFGVGYEDHKSLNSGYAVALSGNVLYLDIILFSDLYRSWCAHRGPVCIEICHNTSPSLEKQSDLMIDGETPHHLVDLDPGLVANFGVGYEDHKTFYPGNAVAFPGNVLDFNVVLFSNFYGSSWSGPSGGRSFLASKQIFTVLRENHKRAFAIRLLAIRLLNPFA